MSQISLPRQRGSVGEKCDWQHSMAHPGKPTHRRKNLAKIFYARRVDASFCPNFVTMATEVSRGKMPLAEFDGPSPKTPYRRKNLAKISYASRVKAHFVPNLLPWQRGSVGEKCDWQHSMAHPRKTPIGAKISCASRVIAHFVPNFVAMATGVGRSVKNAIGSIR